MIYNNKGVNSFLKLAVGGGGQLFPLPNLAPVTPLNNNSCIPKELTKHLSVNSSLFAITYTSEFFVSLKFIELFHNTYSIVINDHYL